MAYRNLFHRSVRNFGTAFEPKHHPESNGLVQQLLHPSPTNVNRGTTHFTQLSSPAFLVNDAILRANCDEMQDLVEKANLSLRGHVKTHKVVEIGHMQVSRQNHKKIEVSTLAEAYHFANKGFNDVTYYNNLFLLSNLIVF